VRCGEVAYWAFFRQAILSFTLMNEPEGGGHMLVNYFVPFDDPADVVHSLEGWFCDLARVLSPVVPGGVAVSLAWPVGRRPSNTSQYSFPE